MARPRQGRNAVTVSEIIRRSTEPSKPERSQGKKLNGGKELVIWLESLIKDG